MKEVTRQMRKRGFGRVGKTPTLCWFCQNAVPDNDGHGCAWSRHGTSVDGWDVIPSRIRAKDSRRGHDPGQDRELQGNRVSKVCGG